MADTTTASTDQCAVLIVAPSPDDLLLQLGQSLTDTGASVHFTTDVYMAMARLATGEQFAHIVVEAAALDEYERAFLSLAPQYHESSNFYVPRRSVLDEQNLADGRYEILSPDGIVDAVLGIREAETLETTSDVEPPWSQPRTIGAPDPSDVSTSHTFDQPSHETSAPSSNLSTDGGLEADPVGPSLHDAVRERMGADGAAPVHRRRPPGVPAPSQDPTPQSSSRVSREEMDALLGDDDESLEEMTDATRQDGKDEA